MNGHEKNTKGGSQAMNSHDNEKGGTQNMKLNLISKTVPVALVTGIMISLLLSAGSALAVGTPVGTVITNKATATFTDANSNTYTPVDSNIVSVTVSQVAGVSITPLTSSKNITQSGSVNYSVTVTNTGNGNDTYALATTGVPAGWSSVLYMDTNGDGILQTGEQVPGNIISSTGAIVADGVIKAILVVTAPNATSGTATITETATSVFNPSQAATINTTSTILAAVLSVTKTTSPTNPKPGDTATYTIQYSNTGTASALATVLTDQIPANTTYKTGSITFGGTAKTDASDGDNADFNVTNPGKVTVTIGTVAAAGSGTIIFQVTVNAGIASTTTVTNVASVRYSTDPLNLSGTLTTINSNSSPFTVTQMAGLQILPATLTTNQLVGDQNLHPFTVKNTGNGTDTYNLTSVGLYWTWTLYNDVDQDGKYTAGIDTPVTDTNADGKLDTGTIASGATKYYIAVVTVTGSNGQVGKHTVTAASLLDPTFTGTSIKYTNIQTPVIALVKSVSPTGPQPPNTQLTYTLNVTNSGLAPAHTFVVSDVMNLYLSYVTSSITVAGATMTDAADGDMGRYDASSGAVIVTIPSISAGATIPITYKATIK